MNEHDQAEISLAAMITDECVEKRVNHRVHSVQQILQNRRPQLELARQGAGPESRALLVGQDRVQVDENLSCVAVS